MDINLKHRILEITYKNKLSHLSSCLTAVDLIDVIYDVKNNNEKFILSCGHAGVALYTVIEKYGGTNAQDIYEHHGVHPDRCDGCGLYYSSGSLGHGLGATVGMALVNRQNIYCLISDGEMAEGSIWEALRIASENKLTNVKLVINANGWAAFQSTDPPALVERLRAFGWAVYIPESLNDLKESLKVTKDIPIAYFCQTDVEQYPFLKGQDAHYVTITKEQYEEVLNVS